MNLNERVKQVVNEQAIAFYAGEVSSSEAFSAIDRVCASPFNWYRGILNDTRDAFDYAVSLMIALDTPKEWTGLLSKLDAQTDEGMPKITIEEANAEVRAMIEDREI